VPATTAEPPASTPASAPATVACSTVTTTDPVWATDTSQLLQRTEAARVVGITLCYPATPGQLVAVDVPSAQRAAAIAVLLLPTKTELAPCPMQMGQSLRPNVEVTFSSGEHRLVAWPRELCALRAEVTSFIESVPTMCLDVLRTLNVAVMLPSSAALRADRIQRVSDTLSDGETAPRRVLTFQWGDGTVTVTAGCQADTMPAVPHGSARTVAGEHWHLQTGSASSDGAARPDIAGWLVPDADAWVEVRAQGADGGRLFDGSMLTDFANSVVYAGRGSRP
jgi:hypothetical protein